ncbi:MAG: ATP-binding protein [Bacteroidales bacterium]|nr:ATP-binding protein [Bacteroidales bacterium]
MRCLNKVVFINSANTPYAEVRLDGNVHFIGTQGVGKSTLLRAILFFYNGDKTKLGIPKEKKGFDDFYLPHSNSYIVYEVGHEHGPFSIVVFRNQGRACFRFIDAPYDRDWFVDGMSGDVTSEYTVIRQRLDGHYMSRIVDHYEEYRNIIYGNHRATDKEFYKFAFMESQKYQNIPRSLQNVFLNSRVDADFIKEIIIRSINDEEAAIDLGYYRRQVADFKQEYDDISIWFRTNSKGENVVRLQAEKVIKGYQSLLYMKEQMVDVYSQMLFAISDAEKKIPLLRKQAESSASDVQKLERLLSEEKDKFDKEYAEINKSLGAVEAKLKEIKAKRKKYSEIRIEEILARVEAEYQVRGRLDSLRQTRDTLMREYESLSAKYEALENNLKADYQRQESFCKEKISSAREEYMKASEKLSLANERKRSEIEASHSEAMALIDEKMEELRAKEQVHGESVVRLNYFKPLGEQIEAQKGVIAGLRTDGLTLGNEIRALDAEIGALTKDHEVSRARHEHERNARLEALKRDADDCMRKIEEIDAMLSGSAGSLYEWLDGNMPGWEHTIGKVVDEKKILYRMGLKPVLSASSEGLFGVKLDLGEVESTVRTPSDLKMDRSAYEEALNDIEASKAEVVLACEKALAGLSDQMAPKTKELRQMKGVAEAKLQSLPQKIKEAQVNLQALEDRQSEMIMARKNELDEVKLALVGSRQAIQQERSESIKVHDKALKALQKDFSEARQQLENVRDAKIGDANAEIARHKVAFDASVSDLKLRRDIELKGAGVDTEALNDCERRISQEEVELKYIDVNRSICLEYQIDKRDLFDNEEELRDNKQALDSKKEQLKAKFDVRGQRLQEQKRAAQAQLESVRNTIHECEEGIDKCVDFQNSETIFPAFLSDVRERATMVSALSLLESMHDLILQRNERSSQFKQAVNIFKGYFGPGNTFNFKTNIVSDEDYMDYAAGLEEFVRQEKIEDYRGRTSDRYLEILSRVSREMGDLTRGGSEVEKIIKDINYDFKEKNFVGAIKSIEIRRTDSGDKMVQLLLRIKEFSDENQFHLSGINLFSDTDEHSDINRQAVRYLQDFMGCLSEFASKQYLSLTDTFQLQFRVVENDNDTGWVEKIANVGSDGTDILVKAMVNIMLINVFKEKVSRRFGEFRIHCMMDEVGKLHPSNVKGILDFANSRNILLVNSSPTTYNVSDYRYTYLLQKDGSSKTIVTPLITRKEAEIGQ